MNLCKNDEYRASKHWPYAIVAGCSVYRKVGGETEILLLSRTQQSDPRSAGDDSQSYHLPKGHVKLGEAIEDAAKRETKEEAACVVTNEVYLGSLHWNFTHPRDKYVSDKTAHYFLAKWVRDQGEIDEEHDAKVWVPIDDAIRLLNTPSNPKNEHVFIERAKKYFELLDES